MIRLYLSSIIDDHKDGWKIQLTRDFSFVSTVTDSNEPLTIHKHCKNSSIFIGYETNNITEEIFKSFLKEHERGLKNKKATINPKNNDGQCFQYAVTVALNHKQIKNYPEKYQKYDVLLIIIIGKK